MRFLQTKIFITIGFFILIVAGSNTQTVVNPSFNSKNKFLGFGLSNCPTAFITHSGPTVFCQGNSLTLQANTGIGYVYQWKKNAVNISNAITSAYTVTSTGVYSVSITNMYGCVANSAPVVVTVNPKPAKPVITANGPLSFCEGGRVELKVTNASGLLYNWFKNGISVFGLSNTNIFDAFSSGVYTVLAQDSSGCQSPLATPVIVNATAYPPRPIITISIGVLVSSSPVGNQWFLNNRALNGATNQHFIPQTNGDYKVKVTVGGCESEFSFPFNYVVTNIVNINNDFGINIFPNPGKSFGPLYLSWNSNASIHKSVYVLVTDLSGRILQEKTFISSPASLQISGSSGLYFVRVYSRDRKLLSISKIILQ